MVLMMRLGASSTSMGAMVSVMSAGAAGACASRAVCAEAGSVAAAPARAESLRKSRRCMRRPNLRLFVDYPALHDKTDFAHAGDVARRVALEANEVGIEAGRDGADLALECHGAGVERLRGFDCRHRLLPAVAHAVDELFGVVPMRPRDRIGAEDDLQARGRQRLLEDLDIQRNRLAHGFKTSGIEIADSHEVRLIVEVVVNHQP